MIKKNQKPEKSEKFEENNEKSLRTRSFKLPSFKSLRRSTNLSVGAVGKDKDKENNHFPLLDDEDLVVDNMMEDDENVDKKAGKNVNFGLRQFNSLRSIGKGRKSMSLSPDPTAEKRVSLLESVGNRLSFGFAKTKETTGEVRMPHKVSSLNPRMSFNNPNSHGSQRISVSKSGKIENKGKEGEDKDKKQNPTKSFDLDVNIFRYLQDKTEDSPKPGKVSKQVQVKKHIENDNKKISGTSASSTLSTSSKGSPSIRNLRFNSLRNIQQNLKPHLSRFLQALSFNSKSNSKGDSNKATSSDQSTVLVLVKAVKRQVKNIVFLIVPSSSREEVAAQLKDANNNSTEKFSYRYVENVDNLRDEELEVVDFDVGTTVFDVWDDDDSDDENSSLMSSKSLELVNPANSSNGTEKTANTGTKPVKPTEIITNKSATDSRVRVVNVGKKVQRTFEDEDDEVENSGVFKQYQRVKLRNLNFNLNSLFNNDDKDNLTKDKARDRSEKVSENDKTDNAKTMHTENLSQKIEKMEKVRFERERDQSKSEESVASTDSEVDDFTKNNLDAAAAHSFLHDKFYGSIYDKPL